MSHIKPILAATVILASLLAAGTAPAQSKARGPDRDWHHRPPGAERQLAHLDRALDLSDEQAQQLLEVLQAADVEREAVHQQIMDQLGPEICALRQSTDAEILAILTPEQAAAYQELRQEHAGRREGRHGGPALDCAGQGG